MGYSVFDDTMADMTWQEIEEAIKQKAVVLLPLGVMEEHGPHMGLAVDTYSSYMVAKLARLDLERKGVKTLISPPDYWGINQLTSGFPGSFNVRPETMKALILDILSSLKSWGVEHVFMVNWHAEYRHVMTMLEAAREAWTVVGIKTYCILTDVEIRNFKLTGREDYILAYRSAPMPGSGAKYIDVHAGSLETGVMAQYFPEQVKEALAESLEPTRITFDDLKVMRSGGETAKKYIPAGYFGDPAHYDRETGRIYVEEKARVLASLVEGAVRGSYRPLDMD